jgi:hypothetical protein
MGDIEDYRCPACDRFLSTAEIRMAGTGTAMMRACAKCGSALVVERSRVVRPLVAELATAFVYPFRPMTLFVSVVVLLASFGASFLPFGTFIGGGIRFAWLFAILRAASVGVDDPEVDPSDIASGIFSWVGPFVRFVMASMVAFFPALLTAIALGPGPVAALLGIAGAAYLPAALVVAAHSPGWFAPLNPVPAMRLIGRIPGPYATACAMLLALFGASALAIGGARLLGAPALAAIVEWFLGFLPLVAAARMLGIMLHESKEEL